MPITPRSPHAIPQRPIAVSNRAKPRVVMIRRRYHPTLAYEMGRRGVVPTVTLADLGYLQFSRYCQGKTCNA
jgi:hypothetical protein